MKKKNAVILIVLLVCLLTLSGSAFLIVSYAKAQEAEAAAAKAEAEAAEEAKKRSLETFAAWTDVEEFQTIPVVSGDNIRFDQVKDYGDKDYMVGVDGATTEDYKAYLETLAAAGFQKHSESSEDALEGFGRAAAFVKDKLSVVVSYIPSQEKMYVSAGYDNSLSDHMIYKDEYVAGISPTAKTTLHMLEIHSNGSSFVIQLKNGHFIVEDGGQKKDAPYFLDYLESLTPEGEKPVIEAWFISHMHSDHYGTMNAISQDQSYLKRIYVNGVYYHRPPTDLIAMSYDADPAQGMYIASTVYRVFTAEDGSQTKFYRPQFGQRYYFCDIVMDVAMTPEQIPADSYYMSNTKVDLNDTSIWLMHYIDGQKLLIGGDAYHTGARAMMNLYSQEYLDLDIFVVLHHGCNVYNYFTDYINATVALYPCFRLGSLYGPESTHTDLTKIPENEHLQERVQEAFSHENGTVVLTFPYKVGTAKIMPLCDWRYDYGIRSKGTW